MNLNIDPNHLMIAIGIVAVIVLWIFYNFGKSNGYAQALDEINRQKTASAFGEYINQLAKGATNEQRY
jgi:hypothetical protein